MSLSIHRITSVRARTSAQSDSSWVEVTFTEPDGSKHDITLFFQTRNKGFDEERRFARELAAAINSVTPMQAERETEEVSPPDEAA